jgi:diphthine synthase
MAADITSRDCILLLQCPSLDVVLMDRGRLIYEPPRYMSPYTAFQQILLTESKRHPPCPTAAALADDDKTAKDAAATSSTNDPAPAPPVQSLLPPSETLAISLSRIGTPTQRIISGTLEELGQLPEDEFGPPLHSVVIVGKRLHPLELEYAGQFAIGGEEGGWWKVGKEVYGVVREGR